MTLRTFEPWPRIEFGPAEREIIRFRDTPPGLGRPLCVICGEPISGRVVHVHHLLMRSGGGDGRPANGIACHPEHQDPGCHITRVHKQPAKARENGWLRSKHAPKPGVYGFPVLCAWRGWIILLDEPGEDGLYWRPERQAT